MKLLLRYPKNTKEIEKEIEIDETYKISDLKQDIEFLFNIVIKKQKIVLDNNQEIKLGDSLIKDNQLSEENNTIHISQKKLKKKNICPFEDCQTKITAQSELLGYCRWCNKTYCCQHRIPESHKCNNYDDCKKSCFDKNAKLVGDMKCVSSKI